MSYCRFQNTLNDLNDCIQQMVLIRECLENDDYDWEEDPEEAALSKNEKAAMRGMIESMATCILDISEDWEEQDIALTSLIDDLSILQFQETMANNVLECSDVEELEKKTNSLIAKYNIWADNSTVKEVEQYLKDNNIS